MFGLRPTGGHLLQLTVVPEDGGKQAVGEAATVDSRHALVLLAYVELAVRALADVDGCGTR